MNPEPLEDSWPEGREEWLDPSGLDLDGARRLRFVLRQSFRYRYEGPVAGVEQRLVVLPPARHGAQRRKSYRLSVVGAEGKASWSRDSFANSVARVQVPVVSESVEFRIDAVIERTGSEPAVLAESALRDPRYLEPTQLTAPNGAISAAANDVVSGAATSFEAAERISALVHDALPYRKGATSIGTTAAEAFEVRAGVCQDHAHVMLAMCRAVGLPARYVSGHMVGEGFTHAWVEVMLPHPGRPGSAVAMPFDPCHGRMPGAAYVTVAIGRDYRDVAPASGTYKGRFSNELSSITHLAVSAFEGADR